MYLNKNEYERGKGSGPTQAKKEKNAVVAKTRNSLVVQTSFVNHSDSTQNDNMNAIVHGLPPHSSVSLVIIIFQR